MAIILGYKIPPTHIEGSRGFVAYKRHGEKAYSIGREQDLCIDIIETNFTRSLMDDVLQSRSMCGASWRTSYEGIDTSERKLEIAKAASFHAS